MSELNKFGQDIIQSQPFSQLLGARLMTLEKNEKLIAVVQGTIVKV